MRTGREEERLVTALRVAGLPAIHHQEVHHGQYEGGHYTLDVGLEPLAVEVHTSKVPPWQTEALYDRALWLLTHGWAVAYLWLRDGAEFTPEAVLTLTGQYRVLGVERGDRVTRR